MCNKDIMVDALKLVLKIIINTRPGQKLSLN